MENENPTYNGWTNYATWRINLEMFDGYNPIDEDDNRPAYEIGDSLKDLADEVLEQSPELALSYARAFLNQVDWREIAEAKLEAHSN